MGHNGYNFRPSGSFGPIDLTPVCDISGSVRMIQHITIKENIVSPSKLEAPEKPISYDEEYYRSSNYADYLERADRYKKTAYELADLLKKLSLLTPTTEILDYGCAIGFLMEGFREVGYKFVTGFEISNWAMKTGNARGNQITNNLAAVGNPEIMVSLDVFEHMTDIDITGVLKKVHPKALVVRIPSSTDGGKTFHLEVSRQDPTHINCKTKEQWIEFLKQFGYHTFLRLNLFTIYDTPGVTCLLVC